MGKRKAAAVVDNPNHDFCEFLLELAEYEKNFSRNIHKYNAYRKAAGVLAALPTRITSGQEAKKLDGIGDKIAKKIDEFLGTGKLQKLENIHEDPKIKTIALLVQVSGIGPAKAQTLVSEGITTLEQLEKHKDKLNHHQIVGLKYFEDFQKKIPRQEIQDIEEIIRKELVGLDPLIQLTICGSYRRGKEESGDIDALITHPNNVKTLLKRVVTVLEKSHLIIETLSSGETKFMGVCKLTSTARRLDIRVIPQHQYYCAVLYFTGSDLFNKEMRAHALEQRFTLNEYSLRPVGITGVPGEPVPIESERDIFECIGYPYKTPEERSK